MYHHTDLRIYASSPQSAVFRLFEHHRDNPRMGLLSSARLSGVIKYAGPDIFIQFDSRRTAVGVEILFYDELTDEEAEISDRNEEAYLAMSKDEQDAWHEKTIPESRYFKLVDNGVETGIAYLLLIDHPEMSGSGGVAKRLPLTSVMQYGGPEIVFEMDDDDVVIGIKAYRNSVA